MEIRIERTQDDQVVMLFMYGDFDTTGIRLNRALAAQVVAELIYFVAELPEPEGSQPPELVVEDSPSSNGTGAPIKLSGTVFEALHLDTIFPQAEFRAQGKGWVYEWSVSPEQRDFLVAQVRELKEQSTGSVNRAATRDLERLGG